MKIVFSHVIREALFSHAVQRRIVLTMGVCIRNALKLWMLLLKGIVRLVIWISPVFLLDSIVVSHFSEQFLFARYVIKNLHSIVDHPGVILRIKALSLRILRACNVSVL